MTGGFGSFNPWQNPGGGGFNWNMLTNVGAGMLANSQYAPGQAFGKGYQQAMGDSLEQAKAGALFQEMDRKKKADEQRQRFSQGMMDMLNAARQPAPGAGGQLQGGGNFSGIQFTPQNAAEAKIWLAQGDTDKATEALFKGDPNMTDVIRNYNMAKQQGYQGTIFDYQKELKGGTTIQMPPNETAVQKKLGEGVGEQLNGYIQQGAQAGQLRGQLQMFSEVLQGVKTGQLESLKPTPAGRWLESMGINLEGMDELQAAKALSRGIAQKMYIPGKGSQSNFEFQALLDQAPAISNTPGGREMISATIDSVAQSQQQAASIAMEVQEGTKTAAQAMREISQLDPLVGWREWKRTHKITPGGDGGGSTIPTYIPGKGWQ